MKSGKWTGKQLVYQLYSVLIIITYYFTHQWWTYRPAQTVWCAQEHFNRTKGAVDRKTNPAINYQSMKQDKNIFWFSTLTTAHIFSHWVQQKGLDSPLYIPQHDFRSEKRCLYTWSNINIIHFADCFESLYPHIGRRRSNHQPYSQRSTRSTSICPKNFYRSSSHELKVWDV